MSNPTAPSPTVSSNGPSVVPIAVEPGKPVSPEEFHCIASIRYPILAQPLALERVLILLLKAREAAGRMAFQWVRLNFPKHGECFLMMRPPHLKSPLAPDGYNLHPIPLTEEAQVQNLVIQVRKFVPMPGAALPICRVEYRILQPESPLMFVHYLQHNVAMTIALSNVVSPAMLANVRAALGQGTPVPPNAQANVAGNVPPPVPGALPSRSPMMPGSNPHPPPPSMQPTSSNPMLMRPPMRPPPGPSPIPQSMGQISVQMNRPSPVSAASSSMPPHPSPLLNRPSFARPPPMVFTNGVPSSVKVPPHQQPPSTTQRTVAPQKGKGGAALNKAPAKNAASAPVEELPDLIVDVEDRINLTDLAMMRINVRNALFKHLFSPLPSLPPSRDHHLEEAVQLRKTQLDAILRHRTEIHAHHNKRRAHQTDLLKSLDQCHDLTQLEELFEAALAASTLHNVKRVKVLLPGRKATNHDYAADETSK